MVNRWHLPDLEFGVGLRGAFVAEVIQHHPKSIGFFAIISENYMDCHGARLARLEQVADRYPIVMHGVSLSVGSTDPIDMNYVCRLGRLADKVGAAWISDHVCWTGVAGINTHDLLPVPLTEQMLRHMSDRVRRICDALGRPIFLENPTTYVGYSASSMPEVEFITRLCENAGCGMLLDINNVFVNAHNQGTSAEEYIDAVDPSYVAQIHVAGHCDQQTHLLDTHDSPVCDAVWELYARYIRRAGPTPTLLERDAEMPPLDALISELDIARQLTLRSCHAASA
jgi:uncharacterized protein